ncbi:UNKNOWN [Stylonychia lemnae]|uniref:Uncharacterized protein n=1 Tax=Stylonychia lemnae TaxID=5949 RepID=A0A078ATK6_STYLE|nr:UNKNOWN [Stylonychia lemnae]|eukprot:CDW85569.1 UNKNOWN [Stylonychia lemnae]
MKNSQVSNKNNQNSYMPSNLSTRSTMTSGSQGLYSREGILQRKQKPSTSVKDKNFTLQKIHEYRRIAFFGSPDEKKVIQQLSYCLQIIRQEYQQDCDFLLGIKKQKQQEFERRDQRMTTCRNHYFDQAQRMREIQKREQMRLIAQDNLMMAANKKRQNIDTHVKDNIRDQQAIHDNKVKYSAMIR